MIKLHKINKWYNKGRSNQLHVVKDTTLEFADKGLVVLLGNSGSGKTTLLNIMSGMDKCNKGTIEIDSHILKKYKAKVWDDIRNDTIGYIFQNYHLLEELTVFENIELVLKMNGIKDPVEIERRISYLLESVNLRNYEDRKASQLSGGQKQRVAFARAMSTNPKVIIADEPTGNLDSKTTIELMNIIKKVSRDKLVVLVTHEQELARFYADRIIEIENGNVVSDKVNEYEGDLSVIQDQLIYLNDLKSSSIENEIVSVQSYKDDTNLQDKVSIELVMRNETLFIKADSTDFKRIKYIDKNSEVELLHESVKDKIDNTDSRFDYDTFIKEPEDKKDRSIVSLKDSFKYAVRKMNKLSYGGKMLYVVLALIGAVIATSVGLLGHIYNVDDTSFVEMNRNYITIKGSGQLYEEIISLEDLDYIEQINFIDEYYTVRLETEKYNQIRSSIELDAHLTNIIFLDESQIIYGTYPTEITEVVIDKLLADMLIKTQSQRGIESYEDILTTTIKMQTSHNDYHVIEESSINFKIVGISNDLSPTLWMSEELMYSLAVPTIVEYKLLGDGFSIVEGEFPTGYRKLLLSEESTLIRQGLTPSSVGISTGRYDITGLYKYEENGVEYNTNLLMVSELSLMKHEYYSYNDYSSVIYYYLAYTNDPEYAISELAKLDIQAESQYLQDYKTFTDFQFEENMIFYIFSLVGIFASALSIYFIMRSSLLSRIYEVSVYRALGSTKHEIRKMFIVEIMLTTTISSVIGFFLMVILLISAQAQVIEYVEVFRFTIINVVFGILGLYTINVLFGLLPINLLMRKTPSDILTRYDL